MAKAVVGDLLAFAVTSELSVGEAETGDDIVQHSLFEPVSAFAVRGWLVGFRLLSRLGGGGLVVDGDGCAGHTEGASFYVAKEDVAVLHVILVDDVSSILIASFCIVIIFHCQ